LVSIGYSSCHWCHVMERESFVDAAVAERMNADFICIKVDREERPDIDQVYMAAVQLMTGRGGWPLNCFTLPDGRPIYGGTYFAAGQWMQVLRSRTRRLRPCPEVSLAQQSSFPVALRNYYRGQKDRAACAPHLGQHGPR